MQEQIPGKLPEQTFRDYTRVLFRQKAVIMTAFITVMLTVFIGLKLKTPQYQATVKMLISAEKQVESPYYRDLMVSRNMEAALTQSEIVKSTPVLERVVSALALQQRPLDYEKEFCSPLKKQLGIIDWNADNFEKKIKSYTPEQQRMFRFRMALENLKKSITVEPVRDTNIFTISVTDYDPVGAMFMANVVSRSYVIFDLEQQLSELQFKYGEKHQMVKQLQDNIGKMMKTLNGLPLENIEAIGPASVKIFEQAIVPIESIGSPKTLIMIMACFMGIFLGVMLAFVFEYMDQTFKSENEVENYLNLPFLGSIPANPKSKSVDGPAEQIQRIAKDKNVRTLLFTTAAAREDFANLVADIGRTLSEKGGKKILFIDANFKSRSLKSFFKRSSSVPGLVEVIEEKVTLEKTVQTVGQNLSVLSVGQTRLNPITVLDSTRMNALLNDVALKYDLILISAPDLTHPVSVQLSAHVDGIVLVVNEGTTRKQAAKSAIFALEKRSTILGAILNNRTFPIPKFIYNRV